MLSRPTCRPKPPVRHDYSAFGEFPALDRAFKGFPGDNTREERISGDGLRVVRLSRSAMWRARNWVKKVAPGDA